jgi:response regulator RpfG family c-di-GMP phosphodiesterase
MYICLIDDDDIFNALHEAVIQMVVPNVRIDIFKSGEQFKKAIEENRFSTIKPDYIFLDIRMPDMDGFTLLEFLQLNHPYLFANTGFYMLSSTLDNRDLEKTRSFQMVKAFIGKPLTVELIDELMSK